MDKYVNIDSPSVLPSSNYLNRIMPIIQEALFNLEKIRPKDEVEFFAAYILDKNPEWKNTLN